MTKNRLEAFSDGVIAILITIMVLEMKVPHGATLESLRPVLPVFLSYVLSFVYLGIYWQNHHHMMQAVRRVGGSTLWANTHLLFWLSLLPFASGWMGENHFETVPVAVYGVVLLCCALAYFILMKVLMAQHGRDSMLSQAIGDDFKGKISILFYVIGIGCALFWNRWAACACYVLVALIWLVPDRRIEKKIIEACNSPNHSSIE